eukprot:m.1448084 g.1448084  ORF g.1448084 m.1448084 type:complete len:975 (+) comp25111_c0_seq5:142-3066(+)
MWLVQLLVTAIAVGFGFWFVFATVMSKVQAERKLREIYGAIEDYRFAQAVLLATQFQKKFKDHAEIKTASALKALALIKTGKSDEARIMIDVLKQQPDLDAGCLMALTACCRELGNFDEILALYEKSYALQPKDEECASQYFMALVRVRKYKRQQQVAMSMYKTFNNNVHYYWSVMSTVMQAHDARRTGMDRLADGMLLPLADKMLRKAIDAGNMTSTEHLRLYIDVLQQQCKFQECLDLLEEDKDMRFRKDSPLLPLGMERDRLVVSLHTKLGQKKEAESLLRKMITGDPDEWYNYVALFDLVLTDGGDDTPEARAAAATDVSAFVGTVAATGEHTYRAPHLAAMELLRRVHGEQLAEKDPVSAQLAAQLLGYIRTFGSKLCCFSDIKSYVLLVSPAHQTQLLQDIEDKVLPQFSEELANKRSQRRVLHFQLQRLCGPLNTRNRSDTAAWEHVLTDLQTRYADVLPLGKDLKGTEWQYSDPYVLVAAHLLYDLYVESGDQTYVLRALAGLEAAMVESASNVQLRLLAIKLYFVLGAVAPAFTHWKVCDVKQVQLDSIGYTMMDCCAYLGAFERDKTEEFFAHAQHFFKSSNTEMPEFIINAYRYGSFGKILEFMDFQDKLKRSLQCAHLGVEIHHFMVLTCCAEGYIPSHVEDVLSPADPQNAADGYADNTDVDVMDTWDAIDAAKYTSIKHKTKAAKERWVAFRLLQLEALVAVVEANTEAVASKRTAIADAFRAGLQTVEEQGLGLGDGRTVFVHGVQFPRASVFASHAHCGNSVDAFLATLEFASGALQLQAAPLRAAELDSAMATLTALLEPVPALLRKPIAQLTERLTARRENGTFAMQLDVEMVYFTMEEVLLPLLTLQTMLDALIPDDTGKKENKAARQTRLALTALLNTYGEHVNTVVAELQTVIKGFESTASADVASKVAQRVPQGEVFQSHVSSVAKAIAASQTAQFRSFGDVVAKMRFKMKN